MKAYKEVYLDEIVETQGKLFENIKEYSEGIDVEDFIVKYMRSEARERIDKADPYVCTKSDKELWEFINKTEKLNFTNGRHIGGFIPNWIGQFYAYFQWYCDIKSKDLIEILPVSEMIRLYGGLHDLDLKLAVKKIVEELSKDGILSQSR